MRLIRKQSVLRKAVKLLVFLLAALILFALVESVILLTAALLIAVLALSLVLGVLGLLILVSALFGTVVPSAAVISVIIVFTCILFCRIKLLALFLTLFVITIIRLLNVCARIIL